MITTCNSDCISFQLPEIFPNMWWRPACVLYSADSLMMTIEIVAVLWLTEVFYSMEAEMCLQMLVEAIFQFMSIRKSLFLNEYSLSDQFFFSRNLTQTGGVGPVIWTLFCRQINSQSVMFFHYKQADIHNGYHVSSKSYSSEPQPIRNQINDSSPLLLFIKKENYSGQIRLISYQFHSGHVNLLSCTRFSSNVINCDFEAFWLHGRETRSVGQN